MSETGRGAGDGSLWRATASWPERPPLDADLAADVCIVGAGVAGLTCGYLLARAGRSVVVLDDGLGAGALTMAQLTPVLGHRYCEFEHLHGEPGARLIATSHMAAIDRIEALVEEEGLECDFARVPGFLFQPPGRGSSLLGRELAAARRAGLQVEWEDRAPCRAFDSGPCLRFERQGQLHPLRYLAGLAAAFEARGGRLHRAMGCTALEDGAPARVRTDGHVVEADTLVVTTNRTPRDHHPLRGRLSSYTTCVLAALLPDGVLEAGLYWDTDFQPEHVLRLQRTPEGTLLLVGGEDHAGGAWADRAGRQRRLEAWARARFPMLGLTLHAWSGEVQEGADGLAFIGPHPGCERIHVVAGDSGHGLTHGTVAGLLLSDLIVEGASPWAALYDPARPPAALSAAAAGCGRPSTRSMGGSLSRLRTSGAA